MSSFSRQDHTRVSYYGTNWRAVESGWAPRSSASIFRAPYDRWNLIRRLRSTGTGSLNEIWWALRDNLDPVAVINDTTTAQLRMAYDAFGNTTFLDSGFAPTTSITSTIWNLLFHEEFEDIETGLYNYGYRFYHTSLGRWLSRDPIMELGGVNLYTFVGNNSSNELDYLGLLKTGDSIDITCGGVLGIGSKKAGTIKVNDYSIAGPSQLNILTGPSKGTTVLGFMATLDMTFTKISDCCCQGGKYRWYQTITQDNAPIDLAGNTLPTPRADTGRPSLAPLYNDNFKDQPIINLNQLVIISKNKGGNTRKISVKFKLEFQCEKKDSITTLKTFSWGLTASQTAQKGGNPSFTGNLL